MACYLQTSAVTLVLALIAGSAHAQVPVVAVAGAPWSIRLTEGPALAAPLGLVRGIRVDSAGNLYVCDSSNHMVVKITPDGTLTPVAGNGTPGFSGDGRLAVEAQLNTPTGVAIDGTGNIYIADSENVRVRRVDRNGIITTFAGSGAAATSGARSSGDGGAATSATFIRPNGVTTDPAGNVYIADYFQIRRVDGSGTISLYAGCVFNGTDPASASTCTEVDGPAQTTWLRYVHGMAFAANGDLYFAESYTHRVRKVTPAGQVITVAGIYQGYVQPVGFQGDGGPALQASLYTPTDVALDANGNLFIADTDNLRIRRVDMRGIIETVAGNGREDFPADGVQARFAGLSHPFSLALGRAGEFYIADTNNLRVRRVDASGVITTIAGNAPYKYGRDNGPAARAFLHSPQRVAFDAAGNLYIADTNNHRVRKVTPAGIITTFAGSGTPGFSGDGGAATAAALNRPTGLAADALGNVYIIDRENFRLRRVSPDGTIRTIAGTGVNATSGDGGPAAAASLYAPRDVAVDSRGNIYIAQDYYLSSANQEPGRNTIRRISPAGVITTFAGAGDAAGGRFGSPTGLDVDREGNVYVADFWGNRLVKITPGGLLTALAEFTRPCLGRFCGPQGPTDVAIAPSGTVYVSTDSGVLRISAAGEKTLVWNPNPFAWVDSLAVDRFGNIVAGESQNDRVRKILLACGTPPEPVTTLGLQPGFYIAVVRNPAGTPGGFWGMEVLVQRGTLAGGFNLGGGSLTTDALTSFGAFYLPSPGTVRIKVDAQVVPGATGIFSMTLRLLNAERQAVMPDRTAATSLEFDTPPLTAGFYIVELRVPPGAPTATYQMHLGAPNFGAGVNTGGYVNDGLVGFGAFYVPEAQNVSLRLFGMQAYGESGAACPALTLLDASRQVVHTAP